MVPLVELRTAPEPSEVIWENLELSDEWEEKAERFSYAVVTIEIVLGLMAIVLVKRWIATSSLEHLDKHDDDSPVWSALEGCARSTPTRDPSRRTPRAKALLKGAQWEQ